MKMYQAVEDNPIASYTPNEKVGHISKKYLGFEEVGKNLISPEVTQILEMGGSLDGDGYKFYFNKELMDLMKLDKPLR